MLQVRVDLLIESAKTILTTVGGLKESIENSEQQVSNLSDVQTKANQLLPALLQLSRLMYFLLTYLIQKLIDPD